MLRPEKLDEMDVNIEEAIRQNELSVVYKQAKRWMDVIVTIMILPVALPLLAVAYGVTYFTSGGPVIFRQKRVGLHGKVFTMYKIRTMVYSESDNQPYTVKNDSRITRTGIWLRKLKLDELPQLWNVMKGEMSLVGPRPERVGIVRDCLRSGGYYYLRHQVKPGMTGWAQVNKPIATPKENFEKLPYDLYYIYHFSLVLEMVIIARTIWVILSMKSL